MDATEPGWPADTERIAIQNAREGDPRRAV
jgi:hypothetical protein